MSNERPIIGVMAQEKLPGDPHSHGTTYIAASYVQFLEGGGARVIPIRTNLTEEEYTKIFHSINGLLLPGGKVDTEMSQFSQAAKILYNLSLKANDAGDYFPIWGTCLGFQQLAYLAANKKLLTLTNTNGVALPLTLTPVAESSRLFRSFPKDLLQSLAEENATSHFHKWSLPMQIYNQNDNLKRFYKVLSTNIDAEKEFISTMEAYQYPFYAVQWHPEKSPYEWIDKPGMVHSTSALRTCFYMASFFVSEAKKSQHHFPTLAEEERALIYNHTPIYKGLYSIYGQHYYFD